MPLAFSGYNEGPSADFPVTPVGARGYIVYGGRRPSEQYAAPKPVMRFLKVDCHLTNRVVGCRALPRSCRHLVDRLSLAENTPLRTYPLAPPPARVVRLRLGSGKIQRGHDPSDLMVPCSPL